MSKGENGVRSNQKGCWLVATWAAFAVGQLYGQTLQKPRCTNWWNLCSNLEIPSSDRLKCFLGPQAQP